MEIAWCYRCSGCNNLVHVDDMSAHVQAHKNQPDWQGHVSMERVDLTAEEAAALSHIRERILVDGRHTTTGCPRFTRAMCSHGAAIKSLEAKGYVHP